MTTYEVRVERDEKYWMITVPAIDRVTMARNLREVEEMARSLIECMTDRPSGPDAVTLDVQLDLPDDVTKHLRRYHDLTETAMATQRDAAQAHRAAARALAEQGLTFRDIGRALGISHQRAEQLVKAAA